jgi:hypothetical protein
MVRLQADVSRRKERVAFPAHLLSYRLQPRIIAALPHIQRRRPAAESGDVQFPLPAFRRVDNVANQTSLSIKSPHRGNFDRHSAAGKLLVDLQSIDSQSHQLPRQPPTAGENNSRQPRIVNYFAKKS